MPEEFERPERELEAVSDVQAEGTGARDKARAAGRDLLDRAVEKKDELKERASTLADERRTGVAQRASSISRALHGAADTLRDNGEPQLSDWVHQAAGQVEKVAGYLEGKRADGMAGDLENLARSNPALFLGGTYVAGLALGRFLRATSPDHRQAPSPEAGEFPGEATRGFEGTGSPESGGGFEPTPGERTGSVSGNLGSTGWSGVGVAPGAFGGSSATEQATSSPSRNMVREGSGGTGSDTARGAGTRRDSDVFGVKSAADTGEARRDFRTAGTSGLGSSGAGTSALGGRADGPGTRPMHTRPSASEPSSGPRKGMDLGGAPDSPDPGAGPEVQTDRDLHEAPPREDRGMRSTARERSADARESERDRSDDMHTSDRERLEAMRTRERDRDREV